MDERESAIFFVKREKKKLFVIFLGFVFFFFSYLLCCGLFRFLCMRLRFIYYWCKEEKNFHFILICLIECRIEQMDLFGQLDEELRSENQESVIL